MNKLVLGFCAVSIAFGMVGVTGCQALEAAKNNVVAGVKGMGIKSDIEKRCADFEVAKDAAGMRAYLIDLQKTDPKPEGWDESIDELVKTWLAKAEALAAENLKSKIEKTCLDFESKDDAKGLQSYLQNLKATAKSIFGWNASHDELVSSWMKKALTMILKTEITTKHQEFIGQGDVDGASGYLSGLLSSEQKPAGWDASVETLVKGLFDGLKGEILKCRCNEIWRAVKAALDQRDFVTARKLTSMAEPYADEELRLDILTYRVGLLNEVVNPYQSDVIIDEMQTRFNSLKDAGQMEQARAYLDTVTPIVDSFPTIEQKVLEIAPALKGLYWLDSRVNAYLQKHIAEIQPMMDARSVGGEYRDYKAVYDLVDAAVAEMKQYNPCWEKATGALVREDVKRWEGSMKNVRRVMTTAEANSAIANAKATLLK